MGLVLGDGAAVEGLGFLDSPDLGSDAGDFLLALLVDSQRDLRWEDEADDGCGGGGFGSDDLF